jgi:hypothetical protein
MMLSRRSVLLGSLGAALALPALEAMLPRRALAAPLGLPGRMVLAFGGIACHADQVRPDGATLTTTPGLAPLFDRGVAEEATLLSNLAMPWGVDAPASWTRPGYHDSAAQILLCGRDSGNDTFSITGPTADGILAQKLGVKAECYRTQVQRYSGTGTYPDYSLSWLPGEDECLAPTIDPWEAYAGSDYSGATTASAEEEARREYLKKKGLSVLDLVKGDAEKLLGKVGKDDRVRLDAYFTEVRALEKELENAVLVGACQPLVGFPTNGDDYGLENVSYEGISTQWGHERERASLHARLIAFALSCGVRRSVSFSISLPQTYLTAYHILAGTPFEDHAGRASDMHQWGHTFAQEEEAHTLFYAWHVDVVAELAALLRDRTEVHPTEGDVSLLDSTALVFVNEAGWGPGLDHEVPSAHSTENMVALTVGGRLLGLRRGEHIVGDGEHPATLMNAVMRRIADGDGLDPAGLSVGDVDGSFDDIFV